MDISNIFWKKLFVKVAIACRERYYHIYHMYYLPSNHESLNPVTNVRNCFYRILVDKEVVATPYMSNTTIMCGRDGKILYQGNSAVSFGANFTTTTLNTCEQIKFKM